MAQIIYKAPVVEFTKEDIAYLKNQSELLHVILWNRALGSMPLGVWSELLAIAQRAKLVRGNCTTCGTGRFQICCNLCAELDKILEAEAVQAKSQKKVRKNKSK